VVQGRRIVEDAIELSRRDGKPLPPPTSGRDFANKMQHVASSFQPPHEWRESDVAKFKYVATEKAWRLYCQHSDLRWRAYEALPAARSFDALLAEVADDPTGIFWG
jgi:hypothetical protein